MKGFKRDGKFIPITDYNKKGTRKSRDQSAKTQGIRMKRDMRKISDQQTFEDFWQEMSERGATSEVLMEADMSANEAVIGTIDEGTNMSYYNIPPLVVGKVAQRKIIESQGGIDEMKEFLAYNADWKKYKKELEANQ